LTPVNILFPADAAQDSAALFEAKEDRLRDIAASVLHHLSVEEEGLEFCMGVALQDNVASDQQWYEVARQSLDEMKAFREYDRSRQREEKLRMNQLSLPTSDGMDSLGLEVVDRLKRRSARLQATTMQQIDDQGQGLVPSSPQNVNLLEQDEAGDTALMTACGSKMDEGGSGPNEYMAIAILEKGGGMNMRNKEGMTALMYAAKYGANGIVRKLCQSSARLETKGIKNTKTALLLAAENGHKPVLETLMGYGADLAAETDTNNALMLSVNNNHLETIRYILSVNEERGRVLDVDHQNRLGFTALMIAAYNGNHRVAELLCKHGANRQLKNKDGNTAYAIARRANHYDLCQLLLPGM